MSKLRQELVQKIGEHVVSSFEKWTENTIGAKLVIPNQIPRKRSAKEMNYLVRLGDWNLRVTVDAPTMVLHTGPGEMQILSLRQAFDWLEKLALEAPG